MNKTKTRRQPKHGVCIWEAAAAPMLRCLVSVVDRARYSTSKMQSRHGVLPVKKEARVGEQMGDPA